MSTSPVAAGAGAATATQATEKEEPTFTDDFNARIDPNAPMGGSRRMMHTLRMMQQQLARLGYRDFLKELETLSDQANADSFSPEKRAAFLAPYMERLADEQQRAEGTMNRSLAERGLDNSSFGAAATSGLAAQGMGLRSDLVNRLYQSEETEQRMAQDQLRALLMAMISGGTRNASAIQQQLAQQQLARAQLNQQGQFDIGGLLRTGLQLYGLSQGLPMGGGGGGGGSDPANARAYGAYGGR